MAPEITTAGVILFLGKIAAIAIGTTGCVMIDAILLGLRFGFQHAGRIPLDHMISSRRLTHVADTMHLVGSLKNHRARSHALDLAIDERFHCSLFYYYQFLVRMFMRSM